MHAQGAVTNAALGAGKGIGAGVIRATGAPTSRRRLEFRVRDSKSVQARLQPKNAQVVDGREILNQPHDSITEVGLPVPFDDVRDLIVGHAARRGVVVEAAAEA